jgi:alkaline phosphatase D
VTTTLDRRRFIRQAGTTAAGLIVASRMFPQAFAGPGGKVFRHGIASGDPLPEGVVLWTRVTPTKDAVPGSGIGPPVEVEWQVAGDGGFHRILREGTTRAIATHDHTVKVDVQGLDPASTYHYRFRALNEISPPGTTKTAGDRGSDAPVRFGLVSCSNFEGGYFAAYGHLADRDDLDFVVHMGDYIYEYGPGGYGPGEEIGRVHEPDHEIVSLADYRIRHAQYKTDPDLQALHAAFPVISAWDDHEVTNDTWREGAENHQEDEGNFGTRQDRAYRAYFEWMPIRLPARQKAPTRIYRSFRFGRMADLHMLDTRQYRDEQVSNQADSARNDPERTITGEAQMRWLKKGLSSEQARWHLVGNQLMITPWRVAPTIPFNIDAWDGYTADRSELLQHVADKEIANVVFLTGDIHTSWANEVPIEENTYPATEPVAVELVGPSITSDNLDEITGSPPRTTSIPAEAGIMAENPWVKDVELDSHGYTVAEANKDRLQMDWYFISDRTDPKATQEHSHSWQIQSGSPRLSEADGPIA